MIPVLPDTFMFYKFYLWVYGFALHHFIDSEIGRINLDCSCNLLFRLSAVNLLRRFFEGLNGLNEY